MSGTTGNPLGPVVLLPGNTAGQLADLDCSWGGDVLPSGVGDLQVIVGTGRGVQRILRRLLTNPGDYEFHPSYGGGLGAFIGQVVNPPLIQAVVQQQMRLEAVVARTPRPVVGVTAMPSGSVFLSISYADADTNTAQAFTFTLGA